MEKKAQNKILIIMSAIIIIFAALIVYLLINVNELKKNGEQGKSNPVAVSDSGVEIYLPEVYYAASGLTMEIYNSQITNLGTHISEYNVLWECEVGEMLERKFSVAATDEMLGEYPLTVTIYDAAGIPLAA